MDGLILKTGFGQMDILNPTPEQVDIEDMINNLARIRRWNGSGELTVLQHSLWVAFDLQRRDCDSNTIICGLLHDAHEYVTGDIPEPLLERLAVKETENHAWSMKRIQAEIQDAIETRFGVKFTDADRDEVAVSDRAARTAETLVPDALYVMVQGMDEERAREVFYKFAHDYSIQWWIA